MSSKKQMSDAAKMEAYNALYTRNINAYGTSGRIAGYSVNNSALIAGQCATLGYDLSAPGAYIMAEGDWRKNGYEVTDAGRKNAIMIWSEPFAATAAAAGEITKPAGKRGKNKMVCKREYLYYIADVKKVRDVRRRAGSTPRETVQTAPVDAYAAPAGQTYTQALLGF